MNHGLPTCIFMIRASSGIPAVALDDLIRYADEVYRVVDIVTDLTPSIEPTTDVVRVIPWPEPGKLPGLMGHNIPYDIVVMAYPETTPEALAYFGEEHNPVMSWPKWGAPDCWTCWVEPRGEATIASHERAREAANLAMSVGVRAHWMPRVQTSVGPAVEVIESRPGGVFATPSPTDDWTAVWEMIFRASGKYRGRIQPRHADL